MGRPKKTAEVIVEDKGVASILDSLSEEQKLALIEHLVKTTETSKIVSTTKKAPKKLAKKVVINTFSEADYLDDPDVKKFSDASHALLESKQKNVSARPETDMVEVSCRNCGKKYQLSSSFPGINNFVCCRGR